jgi:hypothetical protein
VETAHDQQRRAEIVSSHRRDRRVCSSCGQTWPCTSIAWATDQPLSGATLRWRKVRGAAIVAGFLVAPFVVTLLAWWVAR